jgi:hypothetical protein
MTLTEETPTQKVQLSIQGMMIAVAIASGFLAIASFLGFNNGFLIVCAVASGLLTCVFSFAIPRGRFGCATSATVVAALLLCNPMLMFFSIVMAVNCIGHWILVARFKKRRDSPASTRSVIFSSSVIALLAFSIGVAIGIPGYLEYRRELKHFQPVDIAAKLPYETEYEADVPKELVPQNTLSLEYNYSELERKADRFFHGRNWVLKRLHNQYAEQFVKSPGFGVARMFAPSIERAKLPDLKSVGFNESVQLEGWHFERFVYANSVDVDKMHELTMFDFVHPDGIGLEIEPQKFRGFESHAFYQSPIELNDPSGEGTLKLESLQLVSLRRFDSPRVYELDHLPRMDELSGDDVPTRQLTTFESDAIRKLEERTSQLLKNEADTSSKDIVLNESEDSFEMVGALRAINSCLDCHRARRNEMLGAFTYRFSRTNGDE